MKKILFSLLICSPWSLLCPRRRRKQRSPNLVLTPIQGRTIPSSPIVIDARWQRSPADAAAQEENRIIPTTQGRLYHEGSGGFHISKSVSFPACHRRHFLL